MSATTELIALLREENAYLRERLTKAEAEVDIYRESENVQRTKWRLSRRQSRGRLKDSHETEKEGVPSNGPLVPSPPSLDSLSVTPVTPLTPSPRKRVVVPSENFDREKAVEYAKTKHFQGNIEDEIETFLNHHEARLWRDIKDRNAAWRTWLLNAVKWYRPPSGGTFPIKNRPPEASEERLNKMLKSWGDGMKYGNTEVDENNQPRTIIDGHGIDAEKTKGGKGACQPGYTGKPYVCLCGAKGMTLPELYDHMTGSGLRPGSQEWTDEADMAVLNSAVDEPQKKEAGARLDRRVRR